MSRLRRSTQSTTRLGAISAVSGEHVWHAFRFEVADLNQSVLTKTIDHPDDAVSKFAEMEVNLWVLEFGNHNVEAPMPPPNQRLLCHRATTYVVFYPCIAICHLLLTWTRSTWTYARSKCTGRGLWLNRRLLERLLAATTSQAWGG